MRSVRSLVASLVSVCLPVLPLPELLRWIVPTPVACARYERLASSVCVARMHVGGHRAWRVRSAFVFSFSLRKMSPASGRKYRRPQIRTAVKQLLSRSAVTRARPEERRHQTASVARGATSGDVERPGGGRNERTAAESESGSLTTKEATAARSKNRPSAEKPPTSRSVERSVVQLRQWRLITYSRAITRCYG